MINLANKVDYSRLLYIWESAVKNTHHFLREEDFEFYKTRMSHYFEQMKIYAHKDEYRIINGFLGVSGSKVEMLFVDNAYRGTGIGKKLMNFAVNTLNVSRLDVNEENDQAIGFYKHFGFDVIGRSEVDGEGKCYPILHLELPNSAKSREITQIPKVESGV